MNSGGPAGVWASAVVGCIGGGVDHLPEARLVAGRLMTSPEWPFDQAPNVAAITTVNVLECRAPILVVLHYRDDDSWAFLCRSRTTKPMGV